MQDNSEKFSYDIRRLKGAYLLIILRWIAIAWVTIITFIASHFANILTEDIKLYITSGALAIVNIISLLLLNHIKKTNKDNLISSVKKIINFQITSDLVALTFLLHYSGGIENPFIISYIFHMVMASILLSKWESYIQTTLALIFLSLLAFFEYSGIIPHHPINLEIFIEHNLYQDSFYIIRTIFVFVIISYVLVYITNYIVTRLRKQEEAYMLANIQLKQKDSIKDEYVLRVSHDIKADLATIKSCLSVIVNKIFGPVDEKNFDFVIRAYERTTKVIHFVNTLLRLTKMRLTGTLEMEEFSFKKILDNVLANIQNTAKEKSITLKCNTDPAIDMICGNPLSIEEIINNLLYNAIKYTRDKGTVTINIMNQVEDILVEVEDTGIGIPEKDLPWVFNEFYRAGNAKKFDKDGTGLGLSISKQIILLHKGNIWVESKEGKGTKFSFLLPKKPGVKNDP